MIKLPRVFVPLLASLCASFIISWLLTAVIMRLAPRLGFVDRPGSLKTHTHPRPLGGGVAIFLAVCGVLIVVVAGLQLFEKINTFEGAKLQFAFFQWNSSFYPHEFLPGRVQAAYIMGALDHTPLAFGMVASAFILHVLGLIDDKRPLGPYVKLAVQLLIIGLFVTLFDVRAMTFLDKLNVGRLPSILITILWIGTITNAFNFLDNMDGLAAGVAAVCTTAFLITTIMIEQWFVAASLALLLGSLLGFLWFNFPPARIFMGDSGSLVIGFLLGVLTVRTTFLAPNTNLAAGWYGIFAPLIVLAVPLYDFVIVTVLRVLSGRSPFRGDTNHFSHRLVARGMSRRTAVICIYLVTAATSTSAVILPYVRSTLAAILIFCQTVLVLGLVALLEQRPLPWGWRNDEKT